MRKNRVGAGRTEFSILTVDDDEIMTLTLQSYFQAAGFQVDAENDPVAAVERIREQHYDILLLDFLMRPICGSEVVSRVRQFDKDIYIILLTGHKSMAPPIKTIRELDIQGYYEKSDRFDQLELLVESCVKSIRQMRVIRNYRDSLRKILDGIPQFYSIRTKEDAADLMMENLAEYMGVAEYFVYLERDGKEDAHGPVYRGSGLFATEQNRVSAYFEESGKAEGKLILRDGLMIAPLTDESQNCYGIMGICPVNNVRSETAQLFEVYAKQAGAAVGNMLLRSQLDGQNQKLRNAYTAIHENYMGMIDALRLMVDAKDIYTRGHSDRVSAYACKIAKAMGKSEEYMKRIRVAGIFHDIGKIGVDDSILKKDSSLTDEEYEKVKRHCEEGKRILSVMAAFQNITDIVLCHHERYDGSGYPTRRKGEEIPEEARIISVADAFDAMTSKRTYRSELTLDEAAAELIRGKGGQFDPKIVDVFLSILEHYDEIKEELKWTYPEFKPES
jgi:HD-GYP domain-containing protein (c-di-GMP phosphodiesterase class II)/CheY-like chemotaxis protein